MIESAPVYWYDDIDSTSEEAKRRAKRGELSAVWIAARSQSAGKGRLGRSWESPEGNLFSTLLFPEQMDGRSQRAFHLRRRLRFGTRAFALFRI